MFNSSGIMFLFMTQFLSVGKYLYIRSAFWSPCMGHGFISMRSFSLTHILFFSLPPILIILVLPSSQVALNREPPLISMTTANCSSLVGNLVFFVVFCPDFFEFFFTVISCCFQQKATVVIFLCYIRITAGFKKLWVVT